MMFWLLYLSTFFAGTSMTVREGLWSNAITLVNILFSGIVAFAFYSPLAIYLDELLSGEYTYLLDFVCIWVLFIVTTLVCRAVTGLASRTRMRFKNPIDPVGGPVVGLIAGWSMAAFVMATLHTAPMPKYAFSGKLVHSESEIASKSSLLAPDLGWLRFIDRVTRPDAFGRAGRDVFSPAGFVAIYADHREKFENANASWIRVRRN